MQGLLMINVCPCFLILQENKVDLKKGHKDLEIKAVHPSLLAASDFFLTSRFNPEETRAAIGHLCTVVFAVGFIK